MNDRPLFSPVPLVCDSFGLLVLVISSCLSSSLSLRSTRIIVWINQLLSVGL